MIRKIQCFVMALCLLLTAAFGLGVPMTVSAAETDDFEIMYERCYEQTIGAKPGEALDTSNEYVAAFVQNVDKTANENWAIMNKSDDTDRTEIFQGIKPEVGVRPNTATADLTTTFTYLNNLAKAYVTPGTTLYQNEQVPEEIFSAVDFALDNDWYGSTTSGIDLTAYTEESAQAFRAALADAQAVLDDESLTEEDQETVNHAAEQLAAARDALLVKDDSAAPENPDQNGGESSQQGAGTVNNSGNGTDGKEAQNSAAGQKAVKTGDGSAPFAGTAAVMLLAAAAGAAAYRYRREKQ